MMSEATTDWFPLLLSLRVAALATGLVIVLGTPLAFLLARKKIPGGGLVDSLITLPLVLPPTVLGYYLLVVISRATPVGRLYESLFGEPLVFSWQAAVVAAFLHSFPLFTKAVRSAFEEIDQRFEWAAYSLGASGWQTFWQVTLPMVRRSISSLGALAFARSLGDFGVTIMVAGNIPHRTQTLAVAIYDAVESGDGRLARNLVLIMSATALLLLWLAGVTSKGIRRLLPG